MMNVQPYKETPKSKGNIVSSSQENNKNILPSIGQNNLLVTSLPTSPPQKPPSSIIPSDNPLLNQNAPSTTKAESENILPPNFTTNEDNEHTSNENSVTINFKPFEIKTLRFVFKTDYF